MDFFKKYYLAVFQNQYFDFSGKASREQFWYFVLCNIIVFAILSVLSIATVFFSFISFLLALAILIPSIAIGVRRLHDIKFSGLWMLLGLTGIGTIVLIIFWIMPSEK